EAVQFGVKQLGRLRGLRNENPSPHTGQLDVVEALHDLDLRNVLLRRTGVCTVLLVFLDLLNSTLPINQVAIQTCPDIIQRPKVPVVTETIGLGEQRLVATSTNVNVVTPYADRREDLPTHIIQLVVGA